MSDQHERLARSAPGRADRRLHRPDQPRAATAPSGVVDVLGLQRSIGNHAVAAQLVRPVQRDEGGGSGAPSFRCDDTGKADPACYLTVTQRDWLRQEVADRINAAFVNFLFACEHKMAEIKAALEASAKLLDLMLAVPFGWGVTKLAGLAVAGINKIPVGAPDWLQSAALKVLDKPDYVKKPLTVLEGKIRDSVKSRYPKDSLQFVKKLQDERGIWAQTARGEIPGFTDHELMAAFGTWDAQNTQISDYEAALDLLVKQYRLAMLGGETETLMPPQSGMGMSHRTWTNRAVWVNVYHGNLALAMMLVFEEKVDDPKYGSVKKEYFFRDWVAKDMQQLAIDRTKRRYGDIDVIGPNDYKQQVPAMARRP